MSILTHLKKSAGECAFEEYDRASRDMRRCGKPGAYKYGIRYLCQEHADYHRGVTGTLVVEEDA